jgi:hypothetical protein
MTSPTPQDLGDRADALGSAVPSQSHAIERTSPKGGPFVGTCRLCGTPNLTFASMVEECPNQRGLTQDQALIETITGEEK